MDQIITIKNHGKGFTKIAIVGNNKYTPDTMKYATSENIDLLSDSNRKK
jgi:hypothetical protein